VDVYGEEHTTIIIGDNYDSSKLFEPVFPNVQRGLNNIRLLSNSYSSRRVANQKYPPLTVIASIVAIENYVCSGCHNLLVKPLKRM
jgi:hypothetical protein